MDYIQHDDFKKPKFFDDICLLHFKKPFIQNRHVQTIQLTSKTPYYGTDCYISGWGASSVRNLLNSVYLHSACLLGSSMQCSTYQCWNRGRSSTAVVEDLRPMAMATKGGSDLVWYSIDRDIFKTESIFL